MKNYVVRAARDFIDGLENVDRYENDIFECTLERYELLESKKAVELVEVKTSGQEDGQQSGQEVRKKKNKKEVE